MKIRSTLLTLAAFTTLSLSALAPTQASAGGMHGGFGGGHFGGGYHNWGGYGRGYNNWGHYGSGYGYGWRPYFGSSYYETSYPVYAAPAPVYVPVQVAVPVQVPVPVQVALPVQQVAVPVQQAGQ